MGDIPVRRRTLTAEEAAANEGDDLDEIPCLDLNLGIVRLNDEFAVLLDGHVPTVDLEMISPT